VLSGRDPRALSILAEQTGLASVVAPVEQPERVRALLGGAFALLNAAGPFSATARPLLAAALAAGVHYVDLSGEVESLSAVARHHQDARRRGVMLLPGAGFDVVPSDCLAAHLKAALGAVAELSFGVFGLGPPSRGSLETMAEQMGRPVLVRRGGELVGIEPSSVERVFEFEGRRVAALPVSWGDLVTSYYTAGAASITTFFEATPALRAAQALNRAVGTLGRARLVAALKAQTAFLPERPEAPRHAVTIVLEARGPRGARRTLLRTPDVYAVTADAAVALMSRVLQGDLEPGFQTPGRLYGGDFVLTLEGMERRDLAS
jgi:short subunit dehydrogenase-like uncharacterized protein